MTAQETLPKIGKLYKVTSRPRELKFLRPGYIVMPFGIDIVIYSPDHPFVDSGPFVVADIDVLAVKIDETGTSHPFIFKFRTYEGRPYGSWRDFLTEVEDDVELEEQNHEESKEPDRLIS